MPKCFCGCPAFRGYDDVIFTPWKWDICQDCEHNKSDHCLYS